MTTKYSIVIPTRDRHETLPSAIKSVLSIGYTNLEVVICDNASSWHTKSVVDGFTDPRIVYSRSEQRLSMTENFERGLSLASGDYITFIGDDDCVIPDIFPDMQSKLCESDIVCWFRCAYFWNNFHQKSLRGTLSGTLSKHFVEINSSDILTQAFNQFLNYQYLPSVYNSWISKRLIEKIKCANLELGINGFYCNGVISPDVFSALVTLVFSEKFIYSTIPFSLSGISSYSNGSGGRDSKLFAKEYGYSDLKDMYHPQIQLLVNAIEDKVDRNLEVTVGLASDYYLFYEKYRDLIKVDTPNKFLLSLIHTVSRYLSLNSQQNETLLSKLNLQDIFSELPDGSYPSKNYQEHGYIYDDYGVPQPKTFFVDSRFFGVKNSFDASELYSMLLNNPNKLEQTKLLYKIYIKVKKIIGL